MSEKEKSYKKSSELNKKSTQTLNDYKIEFQKNVHMYYHDLKITRNGTTYQIPCENSTLNYIIVSVHELNLEKSIMDEIISTLLQWATQSRLRVRLYKSRDEYESNESQFWTYGQENPA